MAVLRNKKGFTRKRDWVQIKKDIKEGLAQIMCRKGEKWQHLEICSIFSGFQVMRNFAV